jgi:hypothetical protein
MNDHWLRRIAWTLGLGALLVLSGSAIMITLNSTGRDARYLEYLSKAVVACGAPILGLVIVRQQPHNRIGWLWLFYALAVSFFCLTYAIKLQVNNSAPSDYSAPFFGMLLFSETTNLIGYVCLILMILWFPDGKPPTPRWRFLHWWIAVAFVLNNLILFLKRIPWSDTYGVGGEVLLQQVSGKLIGVENSPVAIVISTLAIAALFNPLRIRIQKGIDQRFYRRKYDAQMLLERFVASARGEVELEELKNYVLRVVDVSIQPESASLCG